MAEALMAFRDGESGDLASLGALVLASGLCDLDRCAEFATAYAKAMSR
jgi:hypothetical protein